VAVDEQGAADAGAEGQQQDRRRAVAAGAVAHLGQPAASASLRVSTGAPAALLEVGVDVGADPALVHVGRGVRDPFFMTPGKVTPTRGSPEAPHDLGDPRRRRLGRRGLRGVEADPLAQEPALVEVDLAALDAAATMSTPKRCMRSG
jgi:hypothetical protein